MLSPAATTSSRTTSATALKLIGFGIVDTARLISHRFQLDGVVEAFETAAGRGGLKSMVLPAG